MRHSRTSAALLLTTLLFGISGEVVAGQPKTGRSVRNPGFLEQYAATYRFRNGQPSGVQITRAGDAVLFLRSGPRDFQRDLIELDTASGTERVVATAAALLGGNEEQITAEEQARRERLRLAASGIASFDVARDGRTLLVPISGKLFVIDRKTGSTRELKSSAGTPIDARFSPDGQQIATVRGGDLFVIDVATGAERRLTHGATDTLVNGLAEFVAQEEMGRMHGYWWSPDSRELLYQQTDTSGVEQLSIADPARPNKPAQKWRYPRPGRANAQVRLGLVSVDGGETKWIDWDREAFPYLAGVTWEKHAPPTLLVQNRTQSIELLLAIDPATGQTSELLRETDDAWLNLEPGMPHWRRDGQSFLWSSERSGGWQLELRNRDGSLARVVVPVERNYRQLLGVDEAAGEAWVAAGSNPRETHIDRVPLDKPGSPERVTSEPGIHSAVISSESGVNVRSARTLDGAPVQVAYRSDGSRIAELGSRAAQPTIVPQVELVTIGAPPQLHAAIVRPADFDASRRYPVIVHVYGGPHSQMVTATRSRYLLDAWLADQGFVVVSIDGRGTPSRGRAWERTIRGNFIDAPLADQVRGLQALGEKYRELDLDRVGIFGWSFGGYFSAMAVMQRPDVFRVGVAGAPVTDWLDYDTHYTERYLGLPESDPQAYDVSSALRLAEKLERPLLLIHGTADDNVYFLHSVKLADALFRAGRPFDFLPLAGQTHMVRDPAMVRELYTRIADYLLEHLN